MDVKMRLLTLRVLQHLDVSPEEARKLGIENASRCAGKPENINSCLNEKKEGQSYGSN